MLVSERPAVAQMLFSGSLRDKVYVAHVLLSLWHHLMATSRLLLLCSRNVFPNRLLNLSCRLLVLLFFMDMNCSPFSLQIATFYIVEDNCCLSHLFCNTSIFFHLSSWVINFLYSGYSFEAFWIWLRLTLWCSKCVHQPKHSHWLRYTEITSPLPSLWYLLSAPVHSQSLFCSITISLDCSFPFLYFCIWFFFFIGLGIYIYFYWIKLCGFQIVSKI